MSAAAPRATVYKFGGSSVADAERMRRVAALAAAGPAPLVVVVSALRGVTDDLEALAGGADPGDRLSLLRDRHLALLSGLGLAMAESAELATELEARMDTLEAGVPGEGAPAPPSVRDAILAAGEDMAALLLAGAIRRAGRRAQVVDARTVVRTDARFGAGVPDAKALRELALRHLEPVAADGTVAVLQGFVGATDRGVTTTMGRGGGDFTAALVGGALAAEMVHIWTDVRGVLSGDPASVDEPRFLEEVGFEEAVELAWAGARVIHPVAAKWAVSQGVPLRIRSTFHPEDPGTRVRHDVRGVSGIAAVTAKTGVALIKVRSHPWALPYGFLARVFDVLGRHRLEVDLVATSHSSTAFTIDESTELDALAEELAPFAEVETLAGLTTVTVVGRGLLAEPGMDALVFWAVEKTPVHLISQASDVSLSFVVDASQAPALVRRLHLALIELREARTRRSA